MASELVWVWVASGVSEAGVLESSAAALLLLFDSRFSESDSVVGSLESAARF